MVGGEQTTHAPHVLVAVALDLIVNAFEHQRLVFEGLQRLEDGFELEVFSFDVRPELCRHRAVGRKYDDQPLFSGALGGSGVQTWQRAEKGKRGGGDAQITEKCAAVKRVHNGFQV